jgi:carbon starvation protein CstA
MIIDVEAYVLEDALGNLDFLYPLFSWSLLGSLFLVILFGIYLFIIKSKHRFYHIFTVASCFIWIVIIWLYQSSYDFIRGYSSFSSEWWYRIEKNDNFLLYAIGYITLIDLLLVAHKIFKDKIINARK